MTKIKMVGEMLLFLGFITMFLNGCSENNSNGPTGSNGNTFNIVGTWKSFEIEPYSSVSGASTFVFNSDGSYTWYYKLHNWDLTSAGNYSFVGTTLNCPVFPLINGDSNTEVTITTSEDTFSFLDVNNNRWTYKK